MFAPINIFLSSIKLVSPLHYGFQNKKFTETTIFDFNVKVSNTLHENQLDIGSKAFDSVYQEVLLRKLNCYGGVALYWISSSLTKWAQVL